MKNILSEVIKIELLKNVLSEGRVEDAKAKYPQDTEVVDYFVSQDPSGNNKYLPWMMKTYKQAPEGAREQAKELIPQLVKGFHQHSARLEKKDINQYRSLGELHLVINPLIKSAEKKAIKKEKEESGVKKYYEDADWLLIQPLTYESSCKYGANTKWCIASKDTSTHFKSYTKTGLLVFLIHKKSNHKFALYTDDDDNTYVEIYNPLDAEIADGEMSVKEFLNGLVSGDMGEYINRDDENDDDYEEYTLYKIKEDGSRKYIHDDYDEYSFITEVLDEFWKFYFGRKGVKITPKKLELCIKVIGLFGFNLILTPTKRGENIPWSIQPSATVTALGYTDTILDGDDFDEAMNNGYILDDFIIEEIGNLWGIDDLVDFIVTNRLPFNITGPGIDHNDEKPKEKYENVMSPTQAKAIYIKYSEIGESARLERLKKNELLMDELKNRIVIKDKELIEKIKHCYTHRVNPPNPNAFNQCLSLTHASSTRNSYHIPIGLINPKSGRTLKRTVLDVWRIYNTEVSNAEFNKFIFELFKNLK